MRRSLFVWMVVLAFCLAGKVAHAQSTATCTLTATGAENFSAPCTVEVAYTAAKNETDIYLGISGVAGNTVACGMILREQVTAGGTYLSSSPGVTGACRVIRPNNLATWAAVKGSSSTPDQGTFSVKLTSMGAAITTPGGSLYLAPTGSFTATMPTVTGTDATGTIVFSVVFQGPAKFAAPPAGVKSPVQHAPVPSQPVHKP